MVGGPWESQGQGLVGVEGGGGGCRGGSPMGGGGMGIPESCADMGGGAALSPSSPLKTGRFSTMPVWRV